MSLSRLALRLAAGEALAPFAAAATGPWPTLAGREVRDSPIDPIESTEDHAALLASIEGKPVVSIYTEETATEPYEPARYPPEQVIVTLVVETMIATGGVLVVTDADGQSQSFGTVVAALTDRQREATLDVLESQIVQALLQGPTGALYRRVMTETRAIHSVPQRGDDRTLRLAARTLKLTTKVKNERWPAAGSIPAGLARLPEPLRTVALALDPASSGAELCQALAGLIAVPPAPPAFAGVTVNATFGGVPAPADVTFPPPAS